MSFVVEPHIHMYSRTTDDYQAMYGAGIRACVEPSFWMGCNRRYAGTFFDYFQLILEFETVRARRFGIDHWCAVSLNPKECEDEGLAKEVIDGLGAYLDHPRCVALGEIGFNNITPAEERAFVRQLAIAKERRLPVIVHTPHVNKLEGVKRICAIVREMGMDPDLVEIDHNTEETLALSKATGCYVGMTVYPISKLTPQRVSEMIRRFGAERTIVNGSADWGVSDPLSLPKTLRHLEAAGHSPETIRLLARENALAFYSRSPKWKPELALHPVDPREFQR